ncbi:MAG: FmdB family zinc ribbon protein [Steroidobacteraceae bacterium]
MYEYACSDCREIVSVLVRRIDGGGKKPACPECSGRRLTRVISTFAFHQSLMSKMEQLDPKYDKMIDAASPDLAFDNLVKKYKLDEPMTKPGKK